MRFFVYELINSLDGKVFYVGKGAGDSRFRWHKHNLKRYPHFHLYRKWKKILEQGGSVSMVKVFHTDDEQLAYQVEKDRILLYGRRNLCNMTDGGEGQAIGYRPTRLAYNNMSAAQKRRWSNPEEHQRQSDRIRKSWEANPNRRRILGERSRLMAIKGREQKEKVQSKLGL